MDPFKEENIWVFSDERLPGIEVHNRGRCTFNVYEYNEVVDCFTSYERDETYEVSHAFAKRKAQGKLEDLISESYLEDLET